MKSVRPSDFKNILVVIKSDRAEKTLPGCVIVIPAESSRRKNLRPSFFDSKTCNEHPKDDFCHWVSLNHPQSYKNLIFMLYQSVLGCNCDKV